MTRDLAASEGNLLENKKLIDSLNTLKAGAMKIKDKLQQSAELTASLDSQREVFRPIAHTGSLLFFTLLDLKRCNPMYQYSLPMFLELFRKALAARQLACTPLPTLEPSTVCRNPRYWRLTDPRLACCSRHRAPQRPSGRASNALSSSSYQPHDFVP